MATSSVSSFGETNEAPSPSPSFSKKDVVCAVAAVAGALIAATGIVTLVALALPNAGALNALCSLGPYGGSALLAGGALVTTIALAACLLPRMCSRSPVHTSERADVSESEGKIADAYITDIEVVHDKRSKEPDQYNEWLEMQPVIRKHYSNPQAMRYLVETYKDSPRLLGWFAFDVLYNYADEEEVKLIPVDYNWGMNMAVLDAIRERTDGVFTQVIECYFKKIVSFPFDLFENLTAQELAIIISVSPKNLMEEENMNLANNNIIVMSEPRFSRKNDVIFESLYSSMGALERRGAPEKAKSLHTLFYEEIKKVLIIGNILFILNRIKEDSERTQQELEAMGRITGDLEAMESPVYSWIDEKLQADIDLFEKLI